MKVLVTGATGYLGTVAAEALATRGHEVSGLARSDRSASALRERGIEPVMGDFGDPVSLANAVRQARPDVVVSTASVGGASGDQAAFARDGEAVCALREALTDHGGALVFTSGSAVFGVFNGGDATDTVYDEGARLPLPASVFAPESAGVHPLLAAGFGAAMAARVETEGAVLADGDVRGVVIRPGLVYGHGGNSDLKSLIDRARKEGRAGSLGKRWHNSELRARRRSGRVVLPGSRTRAARGDPARRYRRRHPARLGPRHQPDDRDRRAHRQPVAVGDAGHRRRHSREHQRLVHTAAQRSIGHQPVAEQTLVLGQHARAPRLVAPTDRHLGRRRLRLIRRPLAAAPASSSSHALARHFAMDDRSAAGREARGTR